MIPKDLKYARINECGDLTTVIDRQESPANYAIETIGWIDSKEGMIGVRDNGTKHVLVGYPPSLKVIRDFPMFDKTSQTLYHIAICLDGSSNMSVWVNDGSATAYNSRGSGNGWYELTGSVASTIDAVSSMTVTVNTTSAVAHEFQYWIAYNVTKSEAAFIVDSAINTTKTDLTVDINAQTRSWVGTNTIVLYRHTVSKFAYTPGNGAYPHVKNLLLEQLFKQNIYYGSAATEDATPTMRSPIAVLKKAAARNYFPSGVSTFHRSLPANWYIERGGGGLIPYFTEGGSAGTPSSSVLIPLTTGTTGTITTWMTTSIVGTGTNFLTYLKVGCLLYQPGTGEARQVIQVDDDTHVTVATAFSSDTGTTWGYTFYYNNQYSIDDGSATGWLKIAVDSNAPVEISGTTTYYAKIAVTVVYGYQESDPILRLNRQSIPSGGYNTTLQQYLGLWINFARMNKEVTGIRVYAAFSDSTQATTFADWNTGDSDYLLIHDITLDALGTNRNFVLQTYSENCYQIAVPEVTLASWQGAKSSGATNLKSELGHPPTWATRAYLTPRFGVSTARGGVGIVAVDQDDNTVRLSNYNGDGAHEDDNFAVSLLDNNNLRQRYLLQSLGEMLGLEIVNDKVTAVKRTELETVDFQSGLSTIIPVDTVSRRGILNTRVGLFLPGRNAIKLLSADGTGLLIANSRWINRYDGTERTSDGANSRISDTARAGIIAEYNPIYDEAWFKLTTLDADGTTRYLCYRVKLSTLKWRCREVGCGSTNEVTFFARGTNNTFFIGFGHGVDGSDTLTYNRVKNGILKYPNLDTGTNYTSDTVSRFEDSVVYDGSSNNNDTSSSKGITTRLLFQVGNFYDLLKQSIPWGIIVDAWGDVKGTFASGRYEMKFYANDEYPSAYDTKTHPILQPGSPRRLPARGQLSSLACQISINDDSNLSKYKDFEISLLEIPYLEQVRGGQ